MEYNNKLTLFKNICIVNKKFMKIKKVIVIPITCHTESLDFIQYTSEYLNTSSENLSLDTITGAVVLFNDLEIHTDEQDLQIYWNLFKGKVSTKKETYTLTIYPMHVSRVPENYWSKKINEVIERLIPLKEDESSELSIHSEILLKAINSFLARAKANDKQVLLFLNKKDPVHRFVKSILDMTRELYIASTTESENQCFLPEVRLI
jgi:hypothetical protein